MTTYTPAPEVEALLMQIIRAHHPDIKTARFYCLFRDVPKFSKGKLVFASVKKFPPELTPSAGEHDFLLTVDEKAWSEASPERRAYVLDHEASHCQQSKVIESHPETGEAVRCEFNLTGHDVEDFAAVIGRHGLQTEELENMAAACQQMPLPFPDVAARNDRFTTPDTEITRLMNGEYENRIVQMHMAQ
jgi:hypothetical protein